MKVYCPTCGNDHNEQLVTCSLCGAEFDIAQTKLAVKNQIMKRAIKLWQEAEEPAIMEGHFLDQAEESLRLEMEAKTIKFMCKMATDASDFMKQAAGFCKLSTNEAQAYDWSYNANDFMSKALGLVNLIKNKVAPQAGNASIKACRAKPLQARDMPQYQGQFQIASENPRQAEDKMVADKIAAHTQAIQKATQEFKAQNLKSDRVDYDNPYDSDDVVGIKTATPTAAEYYGEDTVRTDRLSVQFVNRAATPRQAEAEIKSQEDYYLSDQPCLNHEISSAVAAPKRGT